MNFLVKLAIHKILAWAAGLDGQDFATVKLWVANAEIYEAKTGDEKRAFVIGKMKSAWPVIASWAMNLIIELAVAALKKERV